MLAASYSAKTDPGRRRPINEDYVHAASLPGPAGSAEARHLLLVLDGVGGRDRGEWASRTAGAIIAERMPRLLEATEQKQALAQAAGLANTRLWDSQKERGGVTRPAATTMVAALIEAERLWWANVGDSRAYLLRAGGVYQLTRDHSWVSEQVALGSMTPEQAAASQRRNVITRAVGAGPTLEVDVTGPLTLQCGDVLVLCSDGLHAQITPAELQELATRGAPAEAATDLVALVNQRGGPDNVSVIVCRLEGDRPEPDLERTVVAALELRSTQVEQLTIEIDEARRARQVAEVCATDFFQDLLKRSRTMRQNGAAPSAS